MSWPPSSSLMEQKEEMKREEWWARAVSFLVFIRAAPNTVHSAHAHARPSSQQPPAAASQPALRASAHRMGKADDDDDTE
ncbi:hypothetical protein PTSG_12252 [Salpingoeca rosetta]|uniref:Uncharacterized protein n=1 Tax=Salpingoeca rosetta (strain ATCC 50818 / BSB-021) TaxID=946362 RepID=F2U9G0_SALR5|nr:uncharacterized protein PTSG_12252 [Salpingoeca rosetta]EGD73363.1 hypothetical protein PTSG_12252 [Salpingoeca rosetta]|eukprot:XP_004994393.1 hypothetical protein PTSG_12252 [Salpingoeca rosetta]